MTKKLFDEAKKVIPGGVNSPVRAFGSVGGIPIFIQSAQGAYLFDSENNAYIDYVGSWGPMIVGHAVPSVITAVKEAIEKGLSFGAPTEIETQMATRLCELVPSMEKVRMVNSGTEATMSAIRLARGASGRDKIVKFSGCYHGHVDSMLVEAGSGALTLGIPNSAGVSQALAEDTIVLPYNDVDPVNRVFEKIGKQVAAVIVEPIAGNMSCVPATREFLEALRQCCDSYQSLLIFDEVMSGFRVALGGAQALYNIYPDLTVLGKVIGGGLPVGAFGGRAELMDQLAPDGPVYQAGTLSGNPVALSAGLATLDLISKSDFFPALEKKTTTLLSGLCAIAVAAKISFTTNQAGAMFGLFFSNEVKITSFKQVLACNKTRFARFFHAMLEHGVYFAPSPFEAGFISSAHGDKEINDTLKATEIVMQSL